MRLSHPLKGGPPVSGKFGWRGSFELPDGRWTDPIHWGTDWAVPTGTPIYATHDGIVRTNGWDHSYYGGGWQVQITNEDYSTWYLHMNQQSGLTVGSQVRRGQLIGYAGSTGASTGPHLHMEFHINGVPVDPEPYITQQNTTPLHRPPVVRPYRDGDDEMKPTVHVRIDDGKAGEYTRAHPDIGRDLPPYREGSTDFRTHGNVRVYRGFEVTTNKNIGTAWARMHAGGDGNEHSRTNRFGYIQIQIQASRLSEEIHG